MIAQELMLGSRRILPLMLRRVYTAWLLLQLLGFYWVYLIESNLIGHRFFSGGLDPSAAARFGNHLARVLVWQELILLVSLTPSFVAGAITDEKSRGTLQLLLTSDLTAWEILVGKLLGRILHVALLSLAVLPLLCFLQRWSQLGLAAVATLTLISFAIMFALGSLSLLASVWSRQTREAVVVVYLAILSGCLVWLGTGRARFLDPIDLLEQTSADAADRPLVLIRLLIFISLCGIVGLACLLLAAWRLRPAASKQLEGKKGRWWAHWRHGDRALVGDEPVRWREHHLEGIAPFAWSRLLPRWLGALAVLMSTLLAGGYFLFEPFLRSRSLPQLIAMVRKGQIAELMDKLPDASPGFTAMAVVAMFLSTLLVGVRCSGAITGERERLTWEALLLTPLSVKELVRGKLWGTVGAIRPYLLAYAIPVLCMSAFGGPSLVLRMLALSGVTLLAIFFMGAAGLWCSTQSKSSWRSLMATAAIGYVGGFLVYIVAWPVVLMLFLAVIMALFLLDLLHHTNMVQSFLRGWDYWVLGICLAIIAGFIALTEFFLRRAEAYIASRERTRHWRGDRERDPKITN